MLCAGVLRQHAATHSGQYSVYSGFLSARDLLWVLSALESQRCVTHSNARVFQEGSVSESSADWQQQQQPQPLRGSRAKAATGNRSNILAVYQNTRHTFWLIWALAAWFGLDLVFSCLSPFEKHFPYDSNNTLIILNMPKRHLDCYLAALEVTEGKLGGEKDLCTYKVYFA